MKVSVDLIDSNPYRRLKTYPINREKVESLKTSIEQTGFWDNILLRKSDGRYQLAYGHHRLIAIKELGMETVDVPVRPLDDATMLRIMANENMAEWSANPAVMTETVLAARDFLDMELKQIHTWEQFRSYKNKGSNFPGIVVEPEFRTIKSRGAGGETIMAFLGGNWKLWMVQEALATIASIEEKKVDKKAVESFASMSTASEFRRAVEEHEVPLKDQRAIAIEVKEAGADTAKAVRTAVAQAVAQRTGNLIKANFKTEVLPTLDEHLEKAIGHIIQVNSILEELFDNPALVSSDRMKYFLDLVIKTGKTIAKKMEGIK
ncbi:MAG: ParB/RepB/Spo0J family partition protein [Dehalococcoidia bacterium]